MQKGPVYVQKSPVYMQKSPTWSLLDIRNGGVCVIRQPRAHDEAPRQRITGDYTQFGTQHLNARCQK